MIRALKNCSVSFAKNSAAEWRYRRSAKALGKEVNRGRRSPNTLLADVPNDAIVRNGLADHCSSVVAGGMQTQDNGAAVWRVGILVSVITVNRNYR